MVLIPLKGLQKIYQVMKVKNNWKKGDYGVPKNFEKIIEEFLNLEEYNAPLNWMKKFALIKGDATKTIKSYLKKNPLTL